MALWERKKRHLAFISIIGMVGLVYGYFSDSSITSHEFTQERLPLDMIDKSPPFQDGVRLEGNSSTGSLHVVVAFPRMTDKEMANTGGYMNYSSEKLKERELEFVDSLRRNLQHPSVYRVHLFNDRPKALSKMLYDAKGIDLNKITFISSSKDVTFAELFYYVSMTLQGRYAVVINADLYLGEGFTHIDWSYLKSTRVMYSLTRKHVKPIPEGCDYNEQTLDSYCERGSKYEGAHDCYLFYVNSPLTDTFLSELKHKINVYGGENVVIWAFQAILKFRVLNPCKILSIHHNHCSGVRAPGAKYRPRINIDGKSGLAAPTNSLYII